MRAIRLSGFTKSMGSPLLQSLNMRRFLQLCLVRVVLGRQWLRVTRAMEAGIAGHAWTLEEIAGLANKMDALTAFGLFAVTAMMVCYAMDQKSRWFVLGFAMACGLGSIYGFLQGAWPFGVVEAVWMVVAFRRWVIYKSN